MTYTEITERVANQVLDQVIYAPLQWEMVAVQLCEAYLKHPMRNVYLPSIIDRYNRGCPGYQGVLGGGPLNVKEITDDSYPWILELWSQDVVTTANRFIKSMLMVEYFQILDLAQSDNLEYYEEAQLGRRFGHAAFLSYEDLEDIPLDAPPAYSTSVHIPNRVIFNNVTSAFTALEKYLLPHRAFNIEHRIIVVGISEKGEVIYYIPNCIPGRIEQVNKYWKERGRPLLT